MKKSRFTESQIVSILASHDKGQKFSDLCREHGISQATFYQWQRKFGALEVNELKRLKERTQFKRIVADLTLQNRVLKG